MLSKRKLFRILFSGVLVAIFTMGPVLTQQEFKQASIESRLSMHSVEKLHEINQKYSLVSVRELKPERENLLHSTIVQTDLLSMQKSVDNLGVITQIKAAEKNETDLLLSWQPKEKLSQEQLEALAQEFQENIPEVAVAEPDQFIELNTEEEVDAEKEVKQTLRERKKQTLRERKKQTLRETSERRRKKKRKIKKYPDPPLIAIIDSGLYRYHGDFDISKLYKENGKNSLEWNFADNNNNTVDAIGHGTHITGIIHEQSESPLLILSIFKTNTRESKLSYLLSALQYAGSQNAKVINLSLGIRKPSEILRTTVHNLAKKGTVIVAGAGNNGKEEPYYPAAYDDVIAISAVNTQNIKSVISNYGDWVDYAALGENILSYRNADEGYRQMSGTSQAAANATAFIANILTSYEVSNRAELEEILDEKVQPLKAVKEKFKEKLGSGVLR